MITLLTIASLFLIPVASATSNPCAFAGTVVSLSGPLPYAGTLAQQKSGIEEAENLHNMTRTMRFTSTRVGGQPAYRFRFESSDDIVENILFNKGSQSYQLTLIASRQTYRKGLKLARQLLAHPFNGPAIRCNDM